MHKLEDDVWKRQGISLIWDAESLMSICCPYQVISLYRFFQLANARWSEEQLEPLMVNDGRALVVAGLETALDAHDVDDVVEWIEQELYPVMRRYQQDVADGGREAALIFWIAEHRRFKGMTTNPDYDWVTKDTKTKINLTRALFNGASNDSQPICPNKSDDQSIGLYHPRIS